MARGIIIIDKPAGWTSHDVVARLRRLLGERRIGHAGTLDPMATGVLPVFAGRATRAVEFAAGGDKQYIARFRLGIETDTQDTEGTVLCTRPVHAGEDEVRRALAGFRGNILQVPPMYSALKKDGRRLYELAREGKTVERPPRPVTVERLELLGRDGDEYEILVDCSKGTYVRTLCHDIGQALDCGAAMSYLRRTRAAGFSLEDAFTLEQVAEAAVAGDAQRLLLPEDRLFAGYPAMTADARQEAICRNGASFPAQGKEGYYRIYSQSGEFLMLGVFQRMSESEGVMKTVKNFFEVKAD